MKNTVAKFTCSTDDTLAVSLYRGKTALKLSVRQKAPGGRAQVGCKEYYDFEQEADALAAFDSRIKEAVANGWSMTERAEKVAPFTAIPKAPVAPAAADATDVVVKATPKAKQR